MHSEIQVLHNVLISMETPKKMSSCNWISLPLCSIHSPQLTSDSSSLIFLFTENIIKLNNLSTLESTIIRENKAQQALSSSQLLAKQRSTNQKRCITEHHTVLWQLKVIHTLLISSYWILSMCEKMYLGFLLSEISFIVFGIWILAWSHESNHTCHQQMTPLLQ